MFGLFYYHQRIRKSVAVFGKLFNDIYVVRKDASGGGVSTVKVPLSYAPRRKFIDRLNQNPDLDDDTQVAIQLPRMSFEIVDFQYDAARQLTKTQQFAVQGDAEFKRYWTPVPYIINFQLSIYAKGHDDALQVVEQILPFFRPQYTLTVKPIDAFPDIKEDVPITLNDVSFTDDYEGVLEQRRTIIYTLSFSMNINFYGPDIGSGNNIGLIRKAIVDLYHMNGGLRDSDVLIETITVTPDPADASPDSDYGFTTTIELKYDSA